MGTTATSTQASLRKTAALAAVTGITLLATACGSSASSPAATGSRTYQEAVAYAQCVRSHGEPNWPDPTSAGAFSTSQVNINSPQYLSAQHACQNLLPAGDPIQLSPAQQQQLLSQALKWVACVRTHGVPSWPDPTTQDVKAKWAVVNFNLAGTGVNPNASAVQSAMNACAHVSSRVGIQG